MAAQITRTQIAIAMMVAITAMVSSFTRMNASYCNTLDVGNRPAGIHPYTVVAPTLFCATTTNRSLRRLNTG
jgi:hypothetical protein